ncbi:MAG: 1-acyl-sn-glycerol-3-phosphate acyltransferase [Clostridiales Family XIII bacterium]|jgi:1-acyl-sn-glycerol-3-phosphate acyltransferase|nr:1-acyl-sn-glycerol-3-phosphate acyltransferase [Clostridiales Family XIII bacterium]
MSKEKPTQQQRLIRRKLHKPNFIIYQILVRVVVKRFLMKKLNVHFIWKVDLKDYKKQPFILVSNHASRLDYIYASVALLPLTLNYVAGYNEFFRSHLAFLFRLMQVVPKKNFVSDLYSMKSMKRILDEGGRLALFPEGMSSISGTNQPCAIASGKVLKYFDVPVLKLKISGGYLTSTKYCLEDRPGRVEVELDYLFTTAQLRKKTGDQIQEALDEAIYHDDYVWNKLSRNAYDGHGQMAKNLHTLLYRCPRCGSEFKMKGVGDVIFCYACGNGATINEYYDMIPFDETCVIPETQRVWYDMERDAVRDWVNAGDFELREYVRIGTLPTDKYLENQETSEIVGEGDLLLNRDGLHFKGTRGGEPFAFYVRPENLPTYGMCTDVSRFYIFLDNEFIEFYPEHETVAKWFLATEENHRRAGGAWKDFQNTDEIRY